MTKVSLIQRLRKERGYTQDALASALSVHRSTIAKWETGKAMPRAALLPRVAELLGCTVDELLGREEAPNDQRHG